MVKSKKQKTTHRKSNNTDPSGMPSRSDFPNRNTQYIIAILLLVAVAGLYYYYTYYQGSKPTLPSPIPVFINASMLPNVSAADYLAPEIAANITTPEMLFAPSNITGLVSGYTSFVGNRTPVKIDNVPMDAFAMVSVFDNTASAIRQYDHNYNISIAQHTVAGANMTQFEVQGLGDAAAGFALWPEYGDIFTENVKVFIVVFRYNNTVARVGVYEHINSTSPDAAIYLARALLTKLQSSNA